MEITLDQLAEYELRATMAERERCAKIVEDAISPLLAIGLMTGLGGDKDGQEKINGTAAAMSEITTAIRSHG